MKLWDSLTTCLILLSAVRAGALLRSRTQLASGRRRGRAAESPLDIPPVIPPVQTRLSGQSPSTEPPASIPEADPLIRGAKYTMKEPLPDDIEDVIDFIKVTISRIRRSSSSSASSSTSSSTPSPLRETLSSRTRRRRGRKEDTSKGRGKSGRRGAKVGEMGAKNRRGGGGGGRGHGCLLKQIHLNVSDLGLGYRSSEEMIFRYCSGPCRKSESNYDKILFNLVHNKKLPFKDTPLQACCRPIAFDDDLSFLDDSLVYHTVRKHSARKCGCV
ncbi:glial cell line-derived neurotrophic factor-like isoform 1-T2 [Menidia menidia]